MPLIFAKLFISFIYLPYYVLQIFTCGFQDAGLGATGSLLLLLLNLLKPTSLRRHKTTTLITESWHVGVIVHEKVNGKFRSGL